MFLEILNLAAHNKNNGQIYKDKSRSRLTITATRTETSSTVVKYQSKSDVVQLKTINKPKQKKVRFQLQESESSSKIVGQLTTKSRSHTAAKTETASILKCQTKQDNNKLEILNKSKKEEVNFQLIKSETNNKTSIYIATDEIETSSILKHHTKQDNKQLETIKKTKKDEVSCQLNKSETINKPVKQQTAEIRCHVTVIKENPETSVNPKCPTKQDDKQLEALTKSKKEEINFKLNELETSHKTLKQQQTTKSVNSSPTIVSSESCKMIYTEHLDSNYSCKQSKINKIHIKNSESSKIKVELYRIELLHYLLTMHHRQAKPTPPRFGSTRRRLEY
ncbi:hypothetical protein FF38_01044 [Lucilia cuprina]|uniref:Uncharacterized protein n=1 Tax=Lucilia cuprina TaxID=7375 RepID=A0A0L0BVG6_LUCCU|nr:hypothetical protein CVS40_3266 [Lucilia cuprina]KNC23224.1 hypothetical protein FF38_01044 [Lucilia cuprina]